jgi:predicted peptidase
MRSVSLIFVLLSAGCANHKLFAPTREAGFVTLEGTPPTYVYLPKGHTPEKKWPVIVYLHGGDERGDDGIKPTQVGLGPVAWRSRGAFPYVVVFPQAPRKSYFGMPDNNRRVLAALDEVIARHGGDPERVVLTGNSLGGFGTWFMGALYPERWAALVPICGGVRGKAPSPEAPFAAVPEDDRARVVAEKIKHLPVWIFHGRKDWLVPPRFSRELHEALKAAGAEVRYTEIPDAGHNSWDAAYADPALWQWLDGKLKRE